MKSDAFLSSSWQEHHIKQIMAKAGHRYHPKLHVDLPIANIFDGLCRTKHYYHQIREHAGQLTREDASLSAIAPIRGLQDIYSEFHRSIALLLQNISKIKEYNIQLIPWSKINRQSELSQSISWKLLGELQKHRDLPITSGETIAVEKAKSLVQKINSHMHYVHELQKELRYFSEHSSNIDSKLTNCPFLLLVGSAGTGKTHLLCDLVEHRLAKELSYPAVLVFGEGFLKSTDPFEQIIGQLGLQVDKNHFLQSLSQAAKRAGCRAVLLIDALNETAIHGYWKKNLVPLIKEIKKYPHIALVISIRTGFEKEVLKDAAFKLLIREEHHGFRFREWEAVTKFFREFQLPLPEIPLLTPEFQNPLFLFLFCKAFCKRNKKTKQKQIFRGHEGATYIFESFVDSVSYKLSKRFGISTARNENLWDKIIEKIAEAMVINSTDKISEDIAYKLVKGAYPSINAHEFIKELERNMLLVKIPRYSSVKGGYEGLDFRFPFQKFSDHLIARYIFKSYEKSVGKNNKDLITVQKYFSKRRKLGKFLSTSTNQGIVEALSIECPERFNGQEFIQVAPYLKYTYFAQEAFIESIIWRNPDAFTEDLKHTLDYVDTVIITTEYRRSQFLNALLAVSCVPNHPLNANFLHNRLLKYSMPIRDSWWSTYLHSQYDSKTTVDRLIEWGLSSEDRSQVSDDSIRLCSIALIWFLTTSNRFIRDKSTKALVRLLKNKLHLLRDLLIKFHGVNDPYVSQRLYAIAYSCVLHAEDDRSEVRLLAQWIYDNIFNCNQVPIDILLRDYALGIIQIAIQNKVPIVAKPSVFMPPYTSKWPSQIPSEAELMKKYFPKEKMYSRKGSDRGISDIWSSIMFSFQTMGDFGNYVVNRSLRSWSGRRLDQLELTKKQLLVKFKSGLSKRQRGSMEKAMNPYYGLKKEQVKWPFSVDLISEDPEINKDSGNKLTSSDNKNDGRNFDAFKTLLSSSKKIFFEKEIEPFIDGQGRVIDPSEHFNVKLAQQWIFNRVAELYKPDLHGKFDLNLNSNRLDRTNHKAERIGKKYQWIAFYEFMALISDNFEYKGEIWEHARRKFKGSWQLDVRDIDPSLLVFNDSHIKPHIKFYEWRKKHQIYLKWRTPDLDEEWLQNPDFPSPRELIRILDDEGGSWLMLEGFANWQESVEPEVDRFNVPRRSIYLIIKSYIVKSEDLQKFYRWSIKQDFMGRWMPESHDFHETFIGEFPNSIAFQDLRGRDSTWIKTNKFNKVPYPLVITNDSYAHEFGLDCSCDGAISINVPSKWIINNMQLNHKNIDGVFYGRNDKVIAFPTGIYESTFPRALLMRKEPFLDFLKKQKCSVLWTISGEKQISGGNHTIGKYKGRLELSGAYVLNEKGNITGSSSKKFIS